MEVEVTKAEELLREVSELNEKYEKDAKKTGEKFNIFSILGVESRETSTHSAFLVELLSPKGSHGQGKVFLELFLEMLKKKIPANIPTIDTENSSVEKEKYLGIINETYTEGGRADIVISGVKGSICIENKIYAEDQENQLIRYHDEYVKEGKGGLVLYLTLTGDHASEGSTIDKLEGIKLKHDKDYFSLSYSKDILNWLEECQKSVQEITALREAIGQYINLIKKLTNMNMKEDEKRELKTKILGNKGKFNAAMAIHLLHDDIISTLFEKMKKNVQYHYKDNDDIRVEWGCNMEQSVRR